MNRTDQRPIVVALGGNAISPEHAEGNIDEQFAASRVTARLIVDLISDGHHVVITHGNGPQVGNVLRRVELAAHEVYTLPLQTCVADTQGGMGYMIAECLNNELARRGIARTAAALITMVEVAEDDPAFENPTKPIGRLYSPEQAEDVRRRYGWRMAAIGSRGFRRVVPSPAPLHIIEADVIRTLVAHGCLLIAGGGGGIPVVRCPDGTHRGVEAVIDKDRTSALLAHELNAELLLIATSVPKVAINYGRPDERRLERMTTSEARGWLSEGQFPAGSMGPKVEASLEFLEKSDSNDERRVVICALEELRDAAAGRAGTQIVRS
ncbi:MAG: carbamate kinase [Planctomycetota bacterium]|nr:MAG: carbamate kinase [Planctomycetota bacterium]